MSCVSSWGGLSADHHQVVNLMDPSKLESSICRRPLKGLAFGMGRSYGDSCLNSSGILWVTKGLNRFVAFDEKTGRLVSEAGVLLRDIQRLFVPRGWMLPVTPGTQMVTVGGAIANDVHGKNHHASGSFGDHVLSVTLLRTDGETIVCGPSENADWFSATVGGLGLTGVILRAEVQLRRVAGPWLDNETIPFSGLPDFFHLADDSEAGWEHTVSWIDCARRAGVRGLFTRSKPSERTQPFSSRPSVLTMPVTPPISLVNELSLKPFNLAYYHLNKLKAGRSVDHFERLFYPLDNLLNWNRMYGPKGFYQYQCVIPRAAGFDAIQAILAEIAKSGDGSFLTVLKTFGNRQPVGMLSFPAPGVTLALDFPNRGIRTQKLFDRLDAIVSEAKGRLYAAKDARMPKELFHSGYPRLPEFLKFRDQGISSDLSRRLIGN